MASSVDWEKVAKRERSERAALRRIGLPRKSLLRKLWWKYDNVYWLPEPIDEAFDWILTRTICLVHNHTPFTEMDNKTIVCSVCAKKLGEH